MRHSFNFSALLMLWIILPPSTDSEGDIVVYQDNLNPMEGGSIRIACRIMNFSRSKTASWSKPGEHALVYCTNDRYCISSSVMPKKYRANSDSKGIYLTISPFSFTEDFSWRCTYLSDAVTYNVIFGNLTIYQNTTDVRDDVVKLTCHIQNFAEHKTASWRRSGQRAVSYCTRDGFCSDHSDTETKYNFSSDANGIHLSVPLYLVKHKQTWICTYLAEYRSYNISAESFLWRNVTAKSAISGEKATISYSFKTENHVPIKSLYKQTRNEILNHSDIKLIATYLNGELVTGDLYRRNDMDITTHGENILFTIHSARENDSGIYTCLVEAGEWQQTMVSFEVLDSTDNSEFDETDLTESFPILIVVGTVVMILVVVTSAALIVIIYRLRRKPIDRSYYNRADQTDVHSL